MDIIHIIQFMMQSDYIGNFEDPEGKLQVLIVN